MRLIDADAVIMDILSAGKIGKLTCIDLIKHSKTIDAVPVVRCKDCRYFKMYKCRMGYSDHDDFCSYGEKNSEVSK